MTSHELAELLLSQKDGSVMISIDDWVWPVLDISVLDEEYTRNGTVIISTGSAEIIE
jgi:hypothetical protein